MLDVTMYIKRTCKYCGLNDICKNAEQFDIQTREVQSSISSTAVKEKFNVPIRILIECPRFSPGEGSNQTFMTES